MQVSERNGFEGLYADLTERIIGCAIEVHRALGPGFLESVYENALAIELESSGIPFVRQKQIELTYAGRMVGIHRLDMLVDNKVIVELKAKDEVCAADKATVLSYLKATGKGLALIVNFGKPTIEVKRFGNKDPKP